MANEKIERQTDIGDGVCSIESPRMAVPDDLLADIAWHLLLASGSEKWRRKESNHLTSGVEKLWRTS